jgi:hypothetical protein
VKWVGEQQGSVVGQEAAPKVVVWPEPEAVVLAMGTVGEAWAL